MSRKRKDAVSLYVAGMYYSTISAAAIETGITAVGIWKALKRSGGFPVVIKRVLVVTECWVTSRLYEIRVILGYEC
jgi:hypothetical protein